MILDEDIASFFESKSRKILLHSCCAPCSGDLISLMKEAGLDLTILFYNPNIHPLREYILRKDENKRYADKLSINFIDLDYNKDDWFARVKGLEHEPERGQRCTLCFDMRFEVSAKFAVDNDFQVFTSSLGISRWKDMNQINTAGKNAASKYENISYWDYNWRKKGGAARMYEIAKQEKFYKQEYCGCVYSLRDTNKWRLSKGKDRIQLGEEYYSELAESPKVES